MEKKDLVIKVEGKNNLKEKLVRKAFWFSSSITPVTVTHNNSSLQYEDHNLKITTLTVWHSVFFAMLGNISLF